MQQHNNSSLPITSASTNLGEINSSEAYYNVTLNSTINRVNQTVSLAGHTKYDFQLAVPAGCNFDLYLYNPTNTIVASSNTGTTGPMNESFSYQNMQLGGSFIAQVRWVSGNGKYNLSITAIPNSAAPKLYNAGVSPNGGIIFTTYNFSTWYNDSDGYAPEQINLVLDSISYPLTWNAATGSNYTRGVLYFKTFPKLEARNHPFYFTTYDGLPNQTSPMYVNVVKPASILVTTGPPYPQLFSGYDAQWSNTTNGNPWEIVATDYRSMPASIYITENSVVQTTTGDLYSPLFDFTSATPVGFQFEFGYRLLALPTSCYVELQVNMSGTWVGRTNFAAINDVWTRLQLNVTQYKGSFIQARIHFYGLFGSHLYVDDFMARGLQFNIPSILNPSIAPSTGNDYTVFRVEVSYQEDNNVFPQNIYLSIWNHSTPDFKVVDFTETNPLDWDVAKSGGKRYYCEFQLFDVIEPHLVAVATGTILLLENFPYYLPAPEHNLPLNQTAVPHDINFESPGGYYTIDDPLYGGVTVVENGTNGNRYFTTGTTAGAAGVTRHIGMVTPRVHIMSNVQVFLRYDTVITSGGLGSLFSVDITTNDGKTWTSLAEYTASFTGRAVFNLTWYKNLNVTVRFLLDTPTLLGIPISTWILDNISFYEVDLTPPVINDVNINNGQWLFGSIPLNINVSDVGFGVDHVEVQMDGVVIGTISTITGNRAEIMLNTTDYTNADHIITIIVVDRSGNQVSGLIQVRIDNTPYWLYLVLIGAGIVIVGFFLYKVKKAMPKIRKVPGTLKKKVVLKEAEPPKDIAKKILEITAVFRRISLTDLARKLDMPNITSKKVSSYLRYMLDEGMIKGVLDENVFFRVIPEKLKATLKEKEADIIKYINDRPKASMTELVKDLHLETVRQEAIEDFVMNLVVEGKLICYFEGDMIIKEEGAASKVRAMPEPEAIPTQEKPQPKAVEGEAGKSPKKKTESAYKEMPAVAEPAPELKAKRSERAPEKELAPKEEKPEEIKPVSIEQLTGEKEAGPVKALAKKASIEDKKADLIALVTSRDHISFDEIKKELDLEETNEEIEDFLFDLIKNRDIKGMIEEDRFLRK
nr:hypothetical protein [Candidatus Sigynarchaeota archaeon]